MSSVFFKAGKNNNKFNFQTLDLNIIANIMMRLYCYAFVFYLALLSHATAQGILSPTGAMHWSSGGVSVSDASLFSSINNPAMLTHLQHWGVGINSEQRFAMPELQTSSLVGYSTRKHFTAAAHVMHFGYSLFNQQRIGISLARKLNEQFSVGISTEYVATNAAEYGNARLIIPSIGISYKPISSLTVGFYLFNPAQQKYSVALVDPVPTYARVGMVYDLSKKVRTLVEFEQMLDQKPVVRGGLRYHPHQSVWISMGASSQPAFYTMGAGVLLKQFRMDMAMVIHQIIGITPQLSLSYPIGHETK